MILTLTNGGDTVRRAYVHRNSDWTEEIRYSPDLAEEKNQKQLRQKGRDIKLGKDYELAEYLEENIIKKIYGKYLKNSTYKIFGRYGTKRA